jgi:hypothetical protein
MAGGGWDEAGQAQEARMGTADHDGVELQVGTWSRLIRDRRSQKLKGLEIGREQRQDCIAMFELNYNTQLHRSQSISTSPLWNKIALV